MYNKFLAGKSVSVGEEIHESGKLEFDKHGNCLTKISAEAELILVKMAGYEKGKFEPKEPVAKVTDREQVKLLEAKIKVLEEKAVDPKDLEAEIAKVAAKEQEIVELTAKVKDLEAEIAKLKKASK